ncbi:large conductance mechanosensitive channel protein MscL [Candidatus Phytoplasma oryzae]|nr:large conductance mechanosensitive channel protein MscL [Candidatus Phytoplasma oryzae]
MKLNLEKVQSFKNGFKHFIFKGDVLKLAIAFIMSQLFTKVVSSLSTDVIMPPLTFIFSKTADLRGLKFKLNDNISVNYGIFIQNVFEFLLVSFCLYIILTFVFKRNQQEDKKIVDISSQTNNKNLELLEQQQVDILKDIKEVLIKRK